MHVVNLFAAARECRGFADDMARIIASGGALDAGWATAPDQTCVVTYAAAVGLPFFAKSAASLSDTLVAFDKELEALDATGKFLPGASFGDDARRQTHH